VRNVYQVLLRIVTMSKRVPQLKIAGRTTKKPKLTIVPFPKTVMARRLGSTNQMALRTGGWAQPSKGGELKFIDTNAGQGIVFGVDDFGAGILLNNIQPGSSASQRIGRKVTLKSVLFRYSFNLGATSTGGSPLRILIVYDRQSNAAAPAITDILLSDDFTSQNNLSNRDRFITIFDHITTPISVQGEYAVADVLYKSVNLEMCFNAVAGGGIGDITSGAIYAFYAQAGNIAVANSNLNARCRVRYQDL